MNNPENPLHPTRRAVLRSIGLAACASISNNRALPENVSKNAELPASSFVDILRPPDLIYVFTEENVAIQLRQSGDTWRSADITLTHEKTQRELPLTLAAESSLLHRVHLRWRASLPSNLRVLGDAWERSYGELGWREIIPERAMPWYFLTFDGASAHGYGVKVGPAALAFWQCDIDGISLWLDVRNGGRGVVLRGRRLHAATVVARQGHSEEDSFAGAKAFCRLMSPSPRLPAEPVYGSNDWYYAYGQNSAEGILRDAALMAELSPANGARPFTVIDDGWQEKKKFPDMEELAGNIRSQGVRPGLWVRPLQARGETDPGLLLPTARLRSKAEAQSNPAYDPTIPEAREKALAKVRQAVAWKYDLVKHDFSTYELLGQWGNRMCASPMLPGWNFHDQSKTTAEVIRELYEAIRSAAGDETVLIGCNVIGHLSAGLFELQRTGDDVSGKIWERTRRMGVNTLAFRLPQHNTFFAMDADCVPITRAIPWELSRNWLNAIAGTGTALLVSPEPAATGPEQREAIRTAFKIVADSKQGATPEDWLHSSTPTSWASGESKRNSIRYEWLEPGGAVPFEI